VNSLDLRVGASRHREIRKPNTYRKHPPKRNRKESAAATASTTPAAKPPRHPYRTTAIRFYLPPSPSCNRRQLPQLAFPRASKQAPHSAIANVLRVFIINTPLFFRPLSLAFSKIHSE
jgi:hypothetical protein